MVREIVFPPPENSGSATAPMVVVAAAAAPTVKIDGGSWLMHADFFRSGPDLSGRSRHA